MHEKSKKIQDPIIILYDRICTKCEMPFIIPDFGNNVDYKIKLCWECLGKTLDATAGTLINYVDDTIYTVNTKPQ